MNSVEFRESDEGMPESDEAIPESGEAIPESDEPVPELDNISTKDSHFIFNEKLYCQTKGIAMGSPLGPLLADIYINYLESKLKRRLEENGVLYWKSFDVDIQFTVETEKNNSISFLDILITRTNIDVNRTGLNTLPIEVLYSFLTITKKHMSIIRVVHIEQLLNILRLQYPREKLNNQKSLMLVPILYPAPTVLLSTYRASQSIDQINFEETHLNYLQQEITSLIYKPNYTELIYYAFDNVISKTSLKIPSDYFTSLREILKLNQVQELLLVFALQDSIHVKCQALARGHVLKWLPEFFQTISNTYESSLFSTSIYRKPTFTGLLLKWNSYVPHSYKFSAISPMIYRAIKICSSYSSMHIEFEYIQNLV
ncbi:unnamed protein product [Rotaria magnacalcarata]|uniref:Helix-turn-helix domain-containing protein n=2 Tax=Rotaria magnacalcarata TaxID=392030 RepID=A0A8S3DG20_9BILA|nr:unnamed protein product [Rotaria magnacalcarata]